MVLKYYFWHLLLYKLLSLKLLCLSILSFIIMVFVPYLESLFLFWGNKTILLHSLIDLKFSFFTFTYIVHLEIIVCELYDAEIYFIAHEKQIFHSHPWNSLVKIVLCICYVTFWCNLHEWKNMFLKFIINFIHILVSSYVNNNYKKNLLSSLLSLFMVRIIIYQNRL